MTYKRLSDLERLEAKSDMLIFTSDGKNSGSITIRQLLGLQQEALNTPCPHCGSRGKYDRRGNCGACGAPVEDLPKT